MDNAEHAAPSAETTKKNKKDKVRSAWISFAGRIVAQLVGAIATVALGVMVLHRYTSASTRPPAELGHDTYARPAASEPLPGQPAVHVIVLTPGMLGVRDGERPWAGDRSCTPALEDQASSAAHLDHGTFRSR